MKKSLITETQIIKCIKEYESGRNEEAHRLSDTYGIGIIHLNVCNPDDSKVLFPAIRRDINYNSLASLADSSNQVRQALNYINSTLLDNKEPEFFGKE